MGNGASVNRRKGPGFINGQGIGLKTSRPNTARERRALREEQGMRKGEGFPPDISPRIDPGQPAGRTGSGKEDSSQKSSSSRRPVTLGIDVPLLLTVATLAILGMVMLFSASWKYSLDLYGSPTTIFTRQLGLLGLGVIGAIGATMLNYHYWGKLALPLMFLTIVLLVAVLIVQDERHGAVRSLFGGSIQPSELAKLAIIVYLSAWLYNRRDQLKDIWFALVPLGVILGLVGSFILMQPDLSALLTVVILGMMLFFLAGGDLRQVLVVGGFGGFVGWLVLQSGIFATGKDRMDSFLAGLRDPFQASDHVQRSLEAFVRGSWFGQGIGKGTAKLTVLPFPHTDSIFAVIGEETGVIGASIVVVLFAILMWRGLRIALRAPDLLGALLAAGLTFWITLEAMVNMAVMVGLLPFAGNALPFVSAGGSNRIVTLAAIGILLNISRLTEKSTVEEQTFGAIIDLRRRDWRGSVPRSRRSSSAGVK
jgi:cell division protein FtsW